jgi:hypothetical protein
MSAQRSFQDDVYDAMHRKILAQKQEIERLRTQGGTDTVNVGSAYTGPARPPAPAHMMSTSDAESLMAARRQQMDDARREIDERMALSEEKILRENIERKYKERMEAELQAIQNTHSSTLFSTPPQPPPLPQPPLPNVSNVPNVRGYAEFEENMQKKLDERIQQHMAQIEQMQEVMERERREMQSQHDAQIAREAAEQEQQKKIQGYPQHIRQEVDQLDHTQELLKRIDILEREEQVRREKADQMEYEREHIAQMEREALPVRAQPYTEQEQFEQEVDEIVRGTKHGKGMLEAYYSLDSVIHGSPDEERVYDNIVHPGRSSMHAAQDNQYRANLEERAYLMPAPVQQNKHISASPVPFKERHDITIIETVDGTKLLSVDGVIMKYNDVATAVACYTSDM